MSFKDVTSYRRNEEKIPGSFEARIGRLRVVITNRHIHFPGKWICHVHPLLDCVELKATTVDEAKPEALQVAQDLVNAMVEDLNIERHEL